MKPDSDSQRRTTDGGHWHSVLGQCDSEGVPDLDAAGFAREVRQRYRRRVRRRLFIGGATPILMLLALFARPPWDRHAASHQAVEPPVSVRPQSSGGNATVPTEVVPAGVASGQLDSVTLRFRAEVDALHDAGRSADERRRMQDAASRVVNQIRQQAELSVLHSPTPLDPPAS